MARCSRSAIWKGSHPFTTMVAWNLRRLAKRHRGSRPSSPPFRADIFLLRETPMMALVCITVPPFGRMHLASLPGDKQPPAYNWQFGLSGSVHYQHWHLASGSLCFSNCSAQLRTYVYCSIKPLFPCENTISEIKGVFRGCKADFALAPPRQGRLATELALRASFHAVRANSALPSQRHLREQNSKLSGYHRHRS
jgi:hypothetical protein